MIKNVVFDIGNVLVQFRWKEVMIELGYSEEQIQALFKGLFLSNWWSEWDRGVIPEEELFEAMRKECKGLENEMLKFMEHKGELVLQFDYVIEWMKELKAKGMKIYLLSNYPRSLFELHMEKSFTFVPYVDGKIISGYVKHIKPEKEIYAILLDTYKLKAEECVFLDDMEANIIGAREMGMKGIVFNGYDEAHKELERIIDQMAKMV